VINPINYNPNTPTITLPFSQWQPQFLQNFAQLYAAFSTNHVPLDAASNAGNHTIIELVEQALPQQTNVSELAVYTKDVSGQTDQIFLRYQGNGQEVQLTTYQIYSLGNFAQGQSNQYFTFLPGNLILIFGYNVAKTKTTRLRPQIIKNVITCQLTPIGPSNQPFLNVSFVAKNTPGILNFMNVATSITVDGSEPIPPLTYLVLGNI
jgi:hypothetical protein